MTDEVRWATLEDKDEVFKIALNAHREIGLFSFSVPKFQIMWDSYALQQGGACGVIGEKGALKGAIFLAITSTYYSDENFLSELFLYVHPEFRASRCARNLIDFAKHVATELKMKLLIGVLCKENTQRKVEFYQRQLGAPIGATFVFEGTEK
jgi:GNAT superfamily N-acetyltransferase